MKQFSILVGAFMFLLPSLSFAGPQDFTLVNGSTGLICYLYVSPSGQDDWQEDILGAAQCLASGEAIQIEFDAGKIAKWDLRVEDDKGGAEEYYELNLFEISEITIHGNLEATIVQ